MKRKGITIWEQHIERIVLAAAALFFVLFAAWQFISQPNAIEERGTVYSPATVDQELLTKAEQVRNGLDRENSSKTETPDHEPILVQFHTQIASAVSPVDRIIPTERQVMLGVDGIAPPEGAIYVTPTIPAPTLVMANQGFDALLPEAVNNIPELGTRYPDPEEPYDITWMTVGSVFDLAEVRRQYGTPQGEALAIPTTWHNNTIEILDVKIEREELADGNWTNLVLLQTLPGEFHTLRPRLSEAKAADVRLRDQVRTDLSKVGWQIAIVRPDFYSLENGSFTPPDPHQFADPETSGQILTPEEADLLKDEGRLSKLQRQLDAMLSELADLGGTMDDEEEDKGGGSSGRGGTGSGNDSGGGAGGRRGGGKGRGAPGPGGAGGMSGSGTPGETGGGDSGGFGIEDEEATQRRIAILQKKIRSKQRSMDKLLQQIADAREALGLPPLDAVAEDTGDEDPFSQSEIVIWGHDITIEPGKTYRYRFTVEVYNPFFARKQNLKEEQQPLAESIVLASEVSEWSAPVHAIPPTKQFITKVYPEMGDLDMGQATAEIYRFYNGRWWRESFPLEPGDRVGWPRDLNRATPDGPQEIDYSTDWFVLDIIPDVDADRDDANEGYGAIVLLQSLSDPSRTVIFDPRQARLDPERSRLDEEVDIAELNEEG